ncbi:MAG: hypothetical protein ACRDJF_13000, partial [Actinomycetota bacterium]
APPSVTLGELAAPRREPPAAPPPHAPSPLEPGESKVKPAQPGPASRDIGPYRGMGTWVDLYDYALREQMDPAAAVQEMAARGVRTLYLQTSRWNLPADIHHPAMVSRFIDEAHARGIQVVGWYLPGFADLDRDLARSLAVLRFATPRGNRFDGFAPDIEDQRAVGDNPLAFSAGVAEYSRRLRSAVGARSALAAIVPDALNNERAPRRWAGFPWAQVAQSYDVVMPMAYWTETMRRGRCHGPFDVEGYLSQVAIKTRALMGAERPIHLIGGVADCMPAQDGTSYANAALLLGSVGASLYDFDTIQENPARDHLWKELARATVSRASDS